MHAIKKAAHKEAWYSQFDANDPENRTYNFFGRANPKPRRPRDLEHGRGLKHTQTENDAPSPIEENRLAENKISNAQYAQPPHAATFGAKPPIEDISPHDKSEDITSNGTGSSLEKSESSRAVAQVSSTSTNRSTSGPRKRKFLPFVKKDDDDLSEPTRTTSSTSLKKRISTKHLTVMSQIRAVFLSWINILLVFVPVGIAVANVDSVNRIAVFVINFVAIVPLAAMLSFATEELALYVGETLGGLLNATFGNAVELIVSIIALTKGEIIIVQTSLIGSMLSNLLLVLGMCFFFGGLKRVEQHFNITVAQTAASLLSLAIGSLIIPTAWHLFSDDNQDDASLASGVAKISRGTSILLLLLYAAYLYFQLSTHVEMYNRPSPKATKRESKSKESGATFKGLATMGAGTGAAASGGQVNQEKLFRSPDDDDDDDDEETPSLTIIGALITLLGSTVLVAFCAEYLVSAIGSITGSVSPEFVGLILLPIVGNAAEHATAVTVAIKDKMDLAIGVAVGSSLQIALLVLPLTVLLSWFGVGKGIGTEGPMTLDFDGFLIAVVFVAMILVNYLIQDGKSHYLEGLCLMVVYVAIALAAFFYPTDVNFAE